MASSPQHEPTMEEILASIRKIISEDASEPAAPSPEPKAAADADVLELTQEVHDEPPAPPAPAPVVVAAPPPPPPVAEPEPVVMEAAPAPKPENDVVFQTIEESPMSEATAVQPHEGIFSDKTRKALEDSFASIQTPKPEPVAVASAPAPHAVSDDPATVQEAFEKAVSESFEPVLQQWLGANSETVIAHMKPLVREWLDEHFPALLEGAVRAEVERVARARH